METGTAARAAPCQTAGHLTTGSTAGRQRRTGTETGTALRPPLSFCMETGRDGVQPDPQPERSRNSPETVPVLLNEDLTGDGVQPDPQQIHSQDGDRNRPETGPALLNGDRDGGKSRPLPDSRTPHNRIHARQSQNSPETAPAPYNRFDLNIYELEIYLLVPSSHL